MTIQSTVMPYRIVSKRKRVGPPRGPAPAVGRFVQSKQQCAVLLLGQKRAKERKTDSIILGLERFVYFHHLQQQQQQQQLFAVNAN